VIPTTEVLPIAAVSASLRPRAKRARSCGDEERFGKCKTKRLGGLKIDCQPKLGIELDAQIGRRFAFENAIYVVGRAAGLSGCEI